MLKQIEDAGIKHCFRAGTWVYCTWTPRKTKNGLMAMLPNSGAYLKFPNRWKQKAKEKSPPNLEALDEVVKIVNQANEKPLPPTQQKGVNRSK